MPINRIMGSLIKGFIDNSVIVYVFIVCSGFTGLVYEVVWHKYLTYFMGSHGKATAIILAVFFFSLSLGYRFFGRVSHRLLKNKLFLYGLIEGLIGAYSLVSPSIFNFLSSHNSLWTTDPFLDIIFSLVLTFGLIGFPTFLMGGTIPVLTDALVSTPSKSHRIHALIYGTNTAGAFGGTICAGFILLEWWGLPLTLMYTGLLNLFICACTYVMYQMNPEGYSGIGLGERTEEQDEKNKAQRSAPLAIFVVSFLSGFYVFSLQNIVIRMAGLSLGSTTYTFSIIVASFILSLALGSLFISVFERILHYRVLLLVQCTIFFSWIFVYVSIPDWPIWFARIKYVFAPHYMNFNLYWISVFFFFLLLLLIPVGLMGMNLPLLFNFLKSNSSHYSTTIGRIYSVNAFASTLGAAVGGYLLFLILDTEEIFSLNLILIASTLPIVAFLTLKENWLRVMSLLICALAIAISVYIPPWGKYSFSPPSRTIFIPDTPGADIETERSRRLRGLHHVAHVHGPDSIVDVVEDANGAATLFVNSHGIANTRRDRHVRALNALLPLYVSPKVETAFFVGLGPGLGPSLVTHMAGIQSVDVAEISGATIQVREYFKKFHGNYAAVEGKLNIIHADALRVLRQTRKTFDLVISEPAFPWVSGVENLYSEEFLTLAKSKMSARGVYAQWFPLAGLDDDTMMIIMKTFHTVFPWVTLWSPNDDGVILILASKTPLNPGVDRLRKVYENYKDLFEEFGFHHYLSPLALQLMSQSALSEVLTKFNGKHSIEFPKIAYKSGRSRFANDSASLQRMIFKILDVPDGRSDYRLLYEKLPEAHTKEFFTHAFKPTATFQRAFKFVNTRFQILYKQAYPENTDTTIADDLYQDYQYLITGNDQLQRSEKKRKDDFLYTMYKRYTVLISAFLPAHYTALSRLIPEKCQNKKCEDAVNLIRGLAKTGDKLLQRPLPSGEGNQEDWLKGL